MTRVVLHPLPGAKRAGRLAELVEELYSAGRRVVVWVADESRRQALDDYLWSYRKLAFVPHLVWSGTMGPVEDPVVLLGEEGNPNGAEVLVVGDATPPAAWAATFAEVHDLVPEDDDDGRRKWWESWSGEHDGEVA